MGRAAWAALAGAETAKILPTVEAPERQIRVLVVVVLMRLAQATQAAQA
jgi:hypothetical protein